MRFNHAALGRDSLMHVRLAALHSSPDLNQFISAAVPDVFIFLLSTFKMHLQWPRCIMLCTSEGCAGHTTNTDVLLSQLAGIKRFWGDQIQVLKLKL